MYKAKNGLIIADSSTGQGWDIETAQDLKNALLMYPLFQTVHDHALWAALDAAIKHGSVNQHLLNVFTEF